ncbi:MAG: hypothetical protein ABW173_07850 [Sphingomonas sp.]
MSERIDAIGRAGVEAALARIAAADLPPGLSAVREGDAIVIRGPGLARALAEDARLRGLVMA